MADKTRIISGNKKGFKLNNPGKGTRPLTDRVKTSLFDLINDFIPKAKILDLYAGGGNFGIEALSRGAQSAVFVDIGRESIEKLEKNLKKTDLIEKSQIIQSNVQDYVRENENNDQKVKFDIIFADPPFDNIIMKHIEDATKLLKKTGLFIFKHPSTQPATDSLNGLSLSYTQKYGSNQLSFYQKV